MRTISLTLRQAQDERVFSAEQNSAFTHQSKYQDDTLSAKQLF